LSEGNFGTEAANELVDLLTKPEFMGKLIVILAGYEDDMNRLMSVNHGLSSRFPDVVNFRPLTASNCMELLSKILTQKKGCNAIPAGMWLRSIQQDFSAF